MDKILIDPIVRLRLQNIALQCKMPMSDVVESLLDFHFDDTEIIKHLKPEAPIVTDMADLTTKRLLG